jgi:signal transduction histidine kinase
MKRRSLILIVLIVLLPVTLLSWFGYRVARDEQAISQQRFRSVMEQRLEEVNRGIAGRFEESERRLREITSTDDISIDSLRRMVRSEPQITQLFVLSPEGTLLYPNPGDELNGTEMSFLQQASRMFTGRDLQNAVALAESGLSEDSSPATELSGKKSVPFLTTPLADMQESQVNALITQQSTENPETNGLQKPEMPEAVLQRRIESMERTTGEPAPAAKQRAAPNSAQQVNQFAPNEGPAQSAIPPQSDSQPGTVNEPDPTTDSKMSDKRDAGANKEADSRLQVGMSPSENQIEQSPQVLNPVTPDVGRAQTQSLATFPNTGGWFVWYWDRGLNLIYWQRRPSGHIIGAALERARWIADLISWLPETSQAAISSADSEPTFRVTSSASEVIYEWGGTTPANPLPYCEIPLAAPLASWRMQCFLPMGQLAILNPQRAYLGFLAGVVAVALTLMTMAWLLVRDYSRDMREASQQVTFVNQVSHELKTPLTNIRMYAELLEIDLQQVAAELGDKPLRRLDVITSEAQRLSRLIGNVLTFARQNRKTLQLNRMTVDLSQLIRQICDRFAPSFQECGLEIVVECRGPECVMIDPDFLEQILGNLISNVEKYAAEGGRMIVRATAAQDSVILDVIDSGPGISLSQRSSVFRPFSRLSNDLRASTGTGIGLSIVRELARLHGGDVHLKDTETGTGCWFQVELRTVNEPQSTSA